VNDARSFTRAATTQGLVTLTEHESKCSDYTLAFVEEGRLRLTLDAATMGNEGRFINDFRGVTLQPGAPLPQQKQQQQQQARVAARANVRFAARVDARGATHMGVFVLPSGRGVAKHEELLLSYGKGYWLARGLLRDGGGEAAGEGAGEGGEGAGDEEVDATDSEAAALAALALGDG
jgi:hypothetical protein